MSTSAVGEFLDKVAKDSALQNEMKSAVEGKTNQATVVAELAAKHGHEFTADEFKAVIDDADQAAVLSDEVLEGVSGGDNTTQQSALGGAIAPMGYKWARPQLKLMPDLKRICMI